jgi:hydrophobe/amphiphile efflux-3 (HAE3) family protein
MQRFWSNLAVQLGKRAGLVTAVGLVVTLFMGVGITQLRFATGQDSYLNRDDAVAIDNVEYQRLFGGQAMLSVISLRDGARVESLFDRDGRARMQRFAERLEVGAGRPVLSVITPLTALEFSDRLVASPDGDLTRSIAGGALLRALSAAQQAGDTASVTARTEDATATLERVSAIPVGERTLDNADWVRFLLYDNQGSIRVALRPFFPNPTTALAITRLEGNQSIDDEGAAAAKVEAAASELRFANATVTTTGAPILLRDLNDYLRGGMLKLGGIAVLAMVVILLLLFDVRWRLLPLGVVLIGVLWAFGLAGYLGIPLTVVTIAGLPVMLGVGIDYAIQMHSRVEEEVVIDRSDYPIQETARRLGPALLVVTFDAIFAFAALRFAKVPMIRDFGLLLAVGIAVICLASIVLPLAILGIREFRSPTVGHDFRTGALGRFVVRLGGLPPASAVPLVVVAIGVFAWGIAVEDRLVIETDPVRWVNQKTQVISDLRTVEREIGGSSELGVFVTSLTQGRNLLADQQVIDEVDRFERRFSADERIVVGSSLIGTLRNLTSVPGAADVTPSAEDVVAAYSVAPRDIAASVATPSGDALNLLFLTTPGTLEDRAILVDDIRDAVAADAPPAGVKLTPSGLAVVGAGLLENLEANRILLTYLSILFVGVFLAVRLRSVVRSLLSLVPVLIAVGLASILAWAFGWQLSPMTAVGGPLVVAACTEFTSLILLRYVEERGRGETPKEAADVAAARTGRAFIVSALTGIAGVAVLSLSSLPLLRDFGRIVALNISVALTSALVVLPPMLIWADDDRRRWVSRGLVVEDEPFVETPYQPAGEGVLPAGET